MSLSNVRAIVGVVVIVIGVLVAIGVAPATPVVIGSCIAAVGVGIALSGQKG